MKTFWTPILLFAFLQLAWFSFSTGQTDQPSSCEGFNNSADCCASEGCSFYNCNTSDDGVCRPENIPPSNCSDDKNATLVCTGRSDDCNQNNDINSCCKAGCNFYDCSGNETCVNNTMKPEDVCQAPAVNLCDNSTSTTPQSTTTTKPTTPSKPTDSTTTKPTTPSKPTDSTTTQAPATKSPSKGDQGGGRHFDAASFIGGIVLCIGLVAIAYFALKFYKSRQGKNYHTL
ncbi:sialomucin core protein 24-like [Babylonia areolata]|uniref:sialomucin core protein 24-like n=1 Tax=Babylonia areolata TaxID=304850 RepID=UPI003FD03757